MPTPKTKLSFSWNVYFFFYRIWLRLILKAIRNCVWIIRYKTLQVTREVLKEKLLTDEDYIISISFVASDILLSLEENSEETQFIKENIHTTNKIVNRCNEDISIQDYLEIYLRLRRTYWNRTPIPDDAPYKQAIEKGDIQPYKNDETGKIYSKLRKERRREKKKNINFLRDLRKIQKYNSIRAINFNLEPLYKYASLASILFICSGFIYTFLLLYPFIDGFTHYFTISDYISSSLDVVLYSIIASALSAIVGNFLFPERSHTAPSTTSEKFTHISDKILIYLIPLTAILSIVMAIIARNEFLFYKTVIFIVMMLLSYVAGKISYLYFENGRRVFTGIICIVFLCSALANKAIDARKKIITDTSTEYLIITKDDSEITNTTHSYITNNSNFIFLYSQKDKRTKVLPIRNIQSLEFKENSLMLYESTIENFDLWKKLFLNFRSAFSEKEKT